ncbi:hypothetical protein G3495_20740 [Shewanella baltica]|uniref:hypothetical protein n=1 Tax=Shewanella baltica TaxID=62322 RepID=UPI00217EBE49|nr:hypothetical protein [Shewanella baltica]MCS6237516.1 hypothetical protein [Shewanella baltica]MCS6272093.1 hypothetical protein [Shewanella baltica]
MKIEAIKRYDIAVDLYKHYNDILIKSTAFIYTIISGLAVFYLANQGVENIKILKYVLACAVVISSVLFFLSSILLKNVGLELNSVANELELDFLPSIKPLYWFLIINAVSMLIILGLGFKYLV